MFISVTEEFGVVWSRALYASQWDGIRFLFTIHISSWCSYQLGALSSDISPCLLSLVLTRDRCRWGTRVS